MPDGERSGHSENIMRIAAAVIIVAVVYYLNTRPSAEVEACENHLLSTLKSPSSYERVDYRDAASNAPGGFVTIEYDAANSYGAIIRGKYRCNMSGTWVTSASDH